MGGSVKRKILNETIHFLYNIFPRFVKER